MFDLIQYNQNMNKYKVVITAVTRDTERYILKTLQNMLKIGKNFNDFRIVIYENDSKDRTLKILKKFENNHKRMKLLTEKNVEINSRTKRLAYARNMVLDYVISNDETKNYDYIINMDTDNIGNLNLTGLKHCFNKLNTNNWDVLGAVTKKYYDIWALRCNAINYNCHDAVRHDVQKGIPKKISTKMHIRRFQIDYRNMNSHKNGLIPVKSCFNGLAIYKMNKIKNCRYDGSNNGCPLPKNLRNHNNICISRDCEHVDFHKQMKNKNDAKIFINTKLRLL